MLKTGNGHGGGPASRARRLPPPARIAAPARSPAPLPCCNRTRCPTLVQRELERMILAGDLAAGAKLNEAAIAELLGVSRGPVREAFRALEESGLVRLEKNRGVFVRQIAVEEADEIYELRAVLDEFAGRRVAQTIAPADLKALRALVERMDRAVARNDVDAYHAANLEFHDTLVALAGNGKLLAHLSAARQRTAPLSPRHARPGRRPARVRARAPRDSRQDRRRPGRRGRACAVRPRDGQPRADASGARRGARRLGAATRAETEKR